MGGFDHELDLADKLLDEAENETGRLQAVINDAVKQLHGMPDSKLDGDGGLAAATWRDNQRLVKRCDEDQADIKRLRGLLPAALELSRLLHHWHAPDLPKVYQKPMEQLDKAALAAKEKR